MVTKQNNEKLEEKTKKLKLNQIKSFTHSNSGVVGVLHAETLC